MKIKYLTCLLVAGFSLSVMGCRSRTEEKPDFSAISSPQAPVIVNETATPFPTDTPIPPAPQPADASNNTSDGPTVFQMAPATLPPTATETPIPTDTPIPTNTPTPPPTATPKPVSVPDEPRRGGVWDLEDGFTPWSNPYGDDCPGSQIAIGWQGFTSRGQYGSSCFVLNEYGPNVFSGRYSQQVTFDFVDSQAGIYRIFDSKPGHTYQVFARIRHVRAEPPMQFQFGVALDGSTDWQGASVQWAPWSQFIVDQWMEHEQTFTASGAKTTIFIKGIHSVATQGGATYIDGIEIIDLGVQ